MRLLQFAMDGYYHIYSRGTDKRDIFLDSGDYGRFLTNLARSKHNLFHGRHEVALLAYVLMPNHFHLVVRQKEANGISTLMERLGNGYAKYFNIKYDRSGRLFESTYKAKVIEDETYLHSVIEYVHRNPEVLYQSLDENARGKEFALYEWSSMRHYQGLFHDPVVDEGEIAVIFGSSQPLALTDPKG
jgi:REP element-mobilizing transposase RayT